jgi:hypothetical protein
MDNSSNLSATDMGPKLGAIRYLMIGLIQRLDAAGQIDTTELLEGVRADRAAIDSDVKERAFLDRIFQETEDILQFTLTVGKTDKN